MTLPPSVRVTTSSPERVAKRTSFSKGSILLNTVQALARVAWPHKSTSRSGANQRRS